MFVLRSGDVSIKNGKLWYSGNGGWAWPSRTDSNIGRVYYIHFSKGAVYPSNNNGDPWAGNPLRCLARQ